MRAGFTREALPVRSVDPGAVELAFAWIFLRRGEICPLVGGVDLIRPPAPGLGEDRFDLPRAGGQRPQQGAVVLVEVAMVPAVALRRPEKAFVLQEARRVEHVNPA